MKSLEQKLSRIDLNLLVSFSMLLKERNVSRAAEKLYVSQPAMSRTLQRLRELFDDPLSSIEEAQKEFLKKKHAGKFVLIP
jgi:hypothetical protein